MTALPAATDWTGAAVTEDGFKTAQTSLRAFLADLLGTTGTLASARTALAATLNAELTKTGAYTVTTADRGKLITATTGTWTLSLPAAATAGDGFFIALKNAGTGTVTVDPSGAEQIDGATTLAFAENESGFIVCTGTAWRTVSLVATPDATGRLISVSTFTSSGTWTKPAGCTRVVALAVGGGGGGGAGGYTLNGQGGGAGELRWAHSAAPSASYAVTIGAGGAADASGGTTTIGALASALGGLAGVAGSGGSRGESGIGRGATSSTAAAANSGGGGGGGAAGDPVGAGGAGGSGYVIIWEFS